MSTQSSIRYSHYKIANAVTLVAIVLSLFLLTMSLPASALEFECSIGKDERFIRVELPGKEHLCEVSVTDRENNRRVMWYANHDTLFCSAKAYALRDKYRSKWGFDCGEWPDRDGIDRLSERHRGILDTQLKSLIATGLNNSEPYNVSGVKAAASTSINHSPSTLALQFFLADQASGVRSDRTFLIEDNGSTWAVVARIGNLIKHIDVQKGMSIDAALISSVSDSGTLEISTVISNELNSSPRGANCYGSQVFYAQGNGSMVARTPHRFVCTSSQMPGAGAGAGAGAGDAG